MLRPALPTPRARSPISHVPCLYFPLGLGGGCPGKARRRARARFDASVRRSTSGLSLRLNASTSRGNAPASRRRSGNPSGPGHADLRDRSAILPRPRWMKSLSLCAPLCANPRVANVHLTAPRPSPPPDFNQQCSYQPDQPHLSDQARECQRQVFRRLLPRQEALLRVQGEDQEEGHRVPHQLGQGDARSRVERRGEGQVQEEPPPLLHGRQDSLHALPLQHLSWLGTGLWECRVCWNRTGEYRRET